MATAESEADDRKKLLVWGYIRNIEKAYKHLSIPSEINNIIYLYQRFYGAWCQKYKSKHITIDKDKSIVAVNKSTHATVYGEEVIKEGVFKWRVKLISYSGLRTLSLPHIGIVENDGKLLEKYLTNVNFDNFGHLFCGGIGDVYSFGNLLDVKANFVWKKDGDILEIKLDLNKGKLYFTKNDSDVDQFCIAVKSSPNGYRFALAVVAGHSQCQFQFIV